MRFRKLRIAWSVLCGIACVLLIVSWMRSYRWHDGLWGRFSDASGFHLASHEGRVQFQQVYQFYIGLVPWRLSLGEPIETGWPPKVFRWFEYSRGGFGVFVAVPAWFLVAVSGSSAAVPWRFDRWHFSLRAMLAATTVAAAVLWFVVYLVG